MEEQIQKLQRDIQKLQQDLSLQGQLVNYGVEFQNLFNYTEGINVISATIATTGNTDTYFIAPRTLTIFQVDFSATTALATSDTNYITWTITNLGQAGTGTKAILAATAAETTKATGGSAISVDTKRQLNISSTIPNLQMIQGDRIRIRAAVTGTLANTVTFPVYFIQYN